MENDSHEQIRKLSQQYSYASIQMHEAVSRKIGLPGTDHKYLGFFLQKEEMTAGELAGLTGLTTGAVTGLIDRLEKKKLVKRKYSEDDRRKVIIAADTKKVMALLVPLYKDYRKESEKLIASFTNKDIKVIESFFQKAIDIMNETTSKLNNK